MLFKKPSAQKVSGISNETDNSATIKGEVDDVIKTLKGLSSVQEKSGRFAMAHYYLTCAYQFEKKIVLHQACTLKVS